MVDSIQAEEIFKAYLKQGKNRITPERFEILRAAFAYSGHFTADELYIAMKNSASDVSRATVYNTLDLLTQCGLVRLRNFGNTIRYFECSLHAKNHDHLICLDCGKIIEIENTGIDNLQSEICKQQGFEPATYSFTIYAHCKNKENCRQHHE